MNAAHGHRVLVTRPPGSWPRLEARLAADGIGVDLQPTTRQVEPLDPAPGERALDRLASYRWILVTSGQGVKALTLRLAARGLDGLPPGMRVGAIGPATAHALTGVGIRVDVVADDPRGEGLGRALAGLLGEGDPVLIVRPEGGPGLLAAALRASGARVDEAPLYRTVPDERAGALAEAAIGGLWDTVVFTAPSSLDAWLEAAGPRCDELTRALSGVTRVAIGPTTAAHLAAAGLPAVAVADAPSEEAVADVLARLLGPP